MYWALSGRTPETLTPRLSQSHYRTLSLLPSRSSINVISQNFTHGANGSGPTAIRRLRANSVQSMSVLSLCTTGSAHVSPQRNIPARGFRPVYYLIGMGAIMTYGFYKYGVGVREHKYDSPTSLLYPEMTRMPEQDQCKASWKRQR